MAMKTDWLQGTLHKLTHFLPLGIQARLSGKPPRQRRQRDPLALWHYIFPAHVRPEVYKPGPTEAAPAGSDQRGWIWRLLFPRKMTPEEKAEKRALAIQRAATRKQQIELVRNANRFAFDLSRTLENMGFCHTVKTERDGRTSVQVNRVKFCRPYKLGRDAIYFMVDTHWKYFPTGVKLELLDTPEVLARLSHACKHHVSVRKTDREFWFCVELESGVGGLSRHVKLAEVLATRPANIAASIARYAYPLGMGRYNKPIWRNFRQEPHLLIAGTTGNGKSTFLHTMICTLIGANTPEQLQFIFVDLKAGLELSPYAELPHVARIPRLEIAMVKTKSKKAETGDGGDAASWAAANGAMEEEEVERPSRKKYVARGNRSELFPAVIYDEDYVPGAVYWVREEVERRLDMFGRLGVRDIAKYNRMAFLTRNMPTLSEIVFVIDEYAIMRQNPSSGALCDELMARIINRSRAVGVHCVICTQTPTSEVIGSLIRNATSARLVLGLADQYISQMLVGNYDAAKIDLPGRAIFVSGRTRLDVQTPFVNDALISKFVKAAISGKGVALDPQRHDVSDTEICEWSLENETGFLKSESIWQEFRGRGLSKKQAEDWCKRHEGTVVTIGLQQYRVMPGTGRFPNQQPRRLLPLSETGEPEVQHAG